MIKKFSLNTAREGMYNVTSSVREALETSGVRDGFCVIFSEHTTAGITINENADPDVVSDLLLGLEKAFPDRSEYRHSEGNSAAHLKASCVGSSAVLLVNDSSLLLGRWQGVYFCEFDGPRTRNFYVKIIKNAD